MKVLYRSSFLQKAVLIIASISITTSLSLPLTSKADAANQSVQQIVEERSKAEIEQKWMQYLPLDLTKMKTYEVSPNVIAPYSAGKLDDKFLQDALNATNFARYLAGLPDDLELDYSLEAQQQATAVLMSRLGTLSHYPSQPADMNKDFYELAYKGASSSNLSAGRKSLYNTVFSGYMSDNGSNNLPTVGHRRWIINPQMKATMFGFATNDSSTYTHYSSMYAFNRDRDPNEVIYDYVAWPSAGFFPIDVLNKNDPWSVSLNTTIYDKTKTSDIYVTISRDSDQKSWKLDSSTTDLSGNYFNVNKVNYGIDNAIIFRPDNINDYIPNDVYHVTIHNVYTLDGQKTSISYDTTLFQLQATYKNTATRYLLVGQKLTFPINGTPTRYTSSNPSIASVDKNGVVSAHKAGYAYITVDGYLGTSNDTISIQVSQKSNYPINNWAMPNIQKANEYGLLYSNIYNYNLKYAVTRYEFVNYVVGMLTALNPDMNLSSYYDKKSPFTDVSNGSDEIIWAYENGIINGTGNNKFSPEATITREQAAVLLLNVYNYLGGINQSTEKLRFTDQSKVSSWAKNAVDSITSLSIMNGISATSFDPKGKYSHEQTITTLLRLFESFDK